MAVRWVTMIMIVTISLRVSSNNFQHGQWRSPHGLRGQAIIFLRFFSRKCYVQDLQSALVEDAGLEFKTPANFHANVGSLFPARNSVHQLRRPEGATVIESLIVGLIKQTHSLILGVENMWSAVSPRGLRVITLIPREANSLRSALLAPSTAYLAAVYATKPISSSVDPRVIILPSVFRRSPWNVRAVRRTPNTFVLSIASQWEISCWSSRPRNVIPLVLITAHKPGISWEFGFYWLGWRIYSNKWEIDRRRRDLYLIQGARISKGD